MSTLKARFLAMRPFSFTVSVGSVLLGFGMAHAQGAPFSVPLFLLTVLGSVAIHAVSNMVNSLEDHATGLDAEDSMSGRGNPIVRGYLSKGQLRRQTYATFALALLCGTFFLVRDPSLWVLIAFGAASAWAYTAPPLRLKYRGLGDIQSIVSFGILMTLGAWAVAQGPGALVASWGGTVRICMLSIPSALLVDHILHVNNHGDRADDIRFGARTLATRLSHRGSETFQMALAFLPHVLLVGMSFFYGYWLLLPLLTLPLAAKISAGVREHYGQPDSYASLVPLAARYHFAFAVLNSAAFFIR